MMHSEAQARLWALAAALALAATPALAHSGGGEGGGFVSGFTHPIFGLDHLVAMVAVGLWGAVLGRPLIYVLPIVFPLVMAVGSVIGMAGVELPAIEIGIAASAIILGLMICLSVRAPIWIAAGIVGVFALLHGNAHGLELPEGAAALDFSIGFVLATGLLHMTGIALGLLLQVPYGRQAVRGLGVAATLAGGYFLFGALAGA
ncbi:MAG: Ni/Fe hydrogenase [Alphaproteobacteria bacterium]|nr:Ni/Fe hydrogenase [Alphaproteobacteria bacterium]